MSWSINEVSRMSGVSSRALRYYQEIGLLEPESTELSGRRLYGQLELLKLQEILVLRELDLPLESIRELLDGEADRESALRRHIESLNEEKDRIERLILTVQRTIEKGTTMTPEEIFEGIRNDPFEPEARRMWGDEAIEESKDRLASLTPEKIERLRSGFDRVHSRIAELHASRVPIEDPRVLDAIREHFEIVSLAWVPDARSYAALGRIYVSDERFRENIGNGNDEMVSYLADAMAVFAEQMPDQTVDG